ncbi:MAG: phytanoyl-CoA dioxygenase family protein [Pseudomonadota bacterium]
MLTPDALKQFETDGYLVVENLLDVAQIAAIKQEYQELMDQLYQDWYAQGLVAAAPEGLSFWDKLEQCYKGDFEWYQPFDISLPHHGIQDDTPMHFGPAVFSMATNPRILDVVEQLIGPEITSNPIQHVRIKPPARALPSSEARAHVTTTDWHQDMGVTLEEADQTQMVTVWLAITDAQIEHGCLQVAPGNRSDLLPHCTRSQVGIAEPFVPQDTARPVPVRAGGAVIFNPYTPHASLPNTSERFRWSFDLRYNVTGQPSGRSQFPHFVARSAKAPDSVLRDWKKWRSMWEDTRHHLAHVAPIAQHRWASDAPYCA